MSSNNTVTKAVYIPREPRLKEIHIPHDVPALHAIRSYWEKEKGRPLTSPTNYLNVKASSEEWYENNDNREEVEVDIIEAVENVESDDEIVVEKCADNDFFVDGSKLKFNHSGNYSYNKSEFVYEGTALTMRSFCRYLLALKTSITAGDVAFCIVASSIISFLPSPNMFDVCFDGKKPSRFKMLGAINYFADVSDHMSTYKFPVCDNGSCILKKDVKPRRCPHTVTKNSSFYYLSIRERIEFLLKSDLKNMFLYPKYKYRSPKVFRNMC